MSEEHLVLLNLILNPWNAVLGFCVWAGIQTLKSMIPAFQDGGSLHRTLRFMCVAACSVFYFVPGPWTSEDLSTVMKLILGTLTGTVTTLAHGVTSDIRKTISSFFKRRAEKATVQDAAKDLDTLIASGKKLVTVFGAVGAGLSGIYGAWLKPEDTTKAKAAYEVTEEGIESLSGDIVELDIKHKDLARAHNSLDKQMAIDIALMRKRIKGLEEELKKRNRAYHVPEDIAVSSNELSMAAQVTIEPEPPPFAGDTAVMVSIDEPKSKTKPKPQIKRDGKKLDLPASKELFK